MANGMFVGGHHKLPQSESLNVFPPTRLMMGYNSHDDVTALILGAYVAYYMTEKTNNIIINILNN